jgi:hypothetical protein
MTGPAIWETSSTNERKTDTSVHVERLALYPARRGRRSARHDNLKDHFQLYWHTERKALDSEHQARRHLIFSQDVAEKFRRSVGKPR